MRRKQKAAEGREENGNGSGSSNGNGNYRCSLINLEETRDDELDAILGELSVLESQFEVEIKGAWCESWFAFF